MKVDNEKVLRKQREKKATIILAERRREKTAARYADISGDGKEENCAEKCAKNIDKHRMMC